MHISNRLVDLATKVTLRAQGVKVYLFLVPQKEQTESIRGQQGSDLYAISLDVSYVNINVQIYAQQ